MNKKVSATVIGGFVVGALLLVVGAVVMFGSGRYFRKTYEFVLYFDSSVNGLRVGAPVKFRGVEIGSVKSILIQVEKNMKVQRIPVIIEIDPEKLTSRGGAGKLLNDPQALKEAIDNGLRGQLQLESFVTGLLFIGLDIFPDSPAKFVQEPDKGGYKYPEIPTQPTTLQKAQEKIGEILAKLEDIDFKQLIESATQTIKGVNVLVNSPDLKRAVQSLDEVTTRLSDAGANIARAANTLEGSVKSLAGDLQLTSAEARAAIKQAGTAVKQSEAAIKEAEETMASIRAVVDPDSTTFYEINRTLKEVSSAARSLRLLANYLERNPRALIFGKPATKED
jgi:phospholipid/cholesterol/gamma-HCH transport system substrate-binding protein